MKLSYISQAKRSFASPSEVTSDKEALLASTRQLTNCFRSGWRALDISIQRGFSTVKEVAAAPASVTIMPRISHRRLSSTNSEAYSRALMYGETFTGSDVFWNIFSDRLARRASLSGRFSTSLYLTRKDSRAVRTTGAKIGRPVSS